MWLPSYSLKTLRTVWVAIILCCEVCVFIAAAARCRWPDLGKGEQTRVLLIADPQILNEESYPERSPFLVTLSRIFVDMNLRKAWRVAKSMRPHAVIFLGDMMDNGFADMHITRYPGVRRSASTRSSLQSSSLPVYYLPGNHDVGLGNGRGTSTLARSRYRAAFGPLSQHVVLGGHSILMVDAPALVDQDWLREQAGESRIDGLPQDLNYLKHLRMQHTPDAPLILLSHIPLYRSNSSCGPLRERGSIPVVRGNGYQTQLSPETSRLLLEEFRPSLIFSGDDHDYCEYTHDFAGEHVPEVTVKSLSIAMGIRQPGFQLLSLSGEARTRAHRPCTLPDQLRIYCWVYVPLIFATIVLAAVRAATAPAPSHHWKRDSNYSLELPAYRAPVSRPLPAPPRKQRYLRRLVEDVWAIAWPPLAVYVVIAVTVSW
ncbi:Metallo-dependent phosphatase-like protein [Lactarius sanguifluus]|nr:Metallo-dependent phosphatase-like protein [Lactarius sanguifluus]